MTEQKLLILPEEQFLKLHFRYDFGNELNTYNLTYTKDLVMDGYITVDFWLTRAEQQSIIDKMNEIDFINLPDTIATFSPGDSVGVIIEPDPGRQFIKAKFEDVEKEVSYFIPLPENNPAARKILELSEFIINIIQQKPQYQNLPQPRGGRI